MPLSDQQKRVLVTLGELVLRAFDSISEHARSKLSGGVGPGGSPLLLEEARQKLLRILYEDRQALQTLQHEPSIARVEVTWLDTNEEEVLYVCRTSSAGIHPDGLEGRLVSYRAALGRLAAIPAGKEVEIALPRRERSALVRARAELHPSLIAAGWDSIDNSFELIDWHVAIESIRRLLDYERQVPGPPIVSDFLAQMFAKDDPPPLLAEYLAGDELATWLAQRILEIERSVGSLPSIGIFVDGEDRIDPLVASIRPKLTERSLRIVGCRDGRDVGNIQEVRVFDIQHVKGLEFEAVFFVGADLLAERLPDLFDRYIYVGITRAAAFLGITCQAGLPKNLEFVRPLLSEQTWAR